MGTLGWATGIELELEPDLFWSASTVLEHMDIGGCLVFQSGLHECNLGQGQGICNLLRALCGLACIRIDNQHFSLGT